jgi:N-acetylmuramoyl-L-alanine amidase
MTSDSLDRRRFLAAFPCGVLGLAARAAAQEYLTVLQRVDYVVHPRHTRIIATLEKNERFSLAQDGLRARVTLHNCVYMPYEDSVNLGYGPVKSLLITWGGPGTVDLVLGLRPGAVVSAQEAEQPPGVVIEAQGDVSLDQSARQANDDPELRRLEAEAEQETQELLTRQRRPTRRIVIDPGHGGFDSGAVGPNGTKEKDVALQIAKRLRSALEKKAGVTPYLTREEDYFLDLSERTVLANRYNADLFVSIHCNASENRSAGGTETFSCSETASDTEAERVAAFENAVVRDAEFFREAPGFVSVEEILFRLERKLFWEESAERARDVQKLFAARLGTRDRGTKSASFYVLRRNRMPSILAETAFISHTQEEILLTHSDFQEKVVRCLVEAVSQA